MEPPERKRGADLDQGPVVAVHRGNVAGIDDRIVMIRDAVLSACGRYRYRLLRVWDKAKPRVLYVMLNPSTADALSDDATIRSCIRIARALDFGGFEVVNIYGLRATNPDELLRSADPIGPLNERCCAEAIRDNDIVVCAWGAHPMAAKSHWLLSRIRSYRPAAYCLGTTKSGAPRHPLYVKTGTPLEVYNGS